MAESSAGLELPLEPAGTQQQVWKLGKATFNSALFEAVKSLQRAGTADYWQYLRV